MNEKQYGERIQALLKSAPQHLNHIPSSLARKLSWKKPLLLTYKILGLLVNTLPADEKYPVLSRDNLMIPTWMMSSKKQNRFCQFFAGFLKSKLNFKYFGQKDDPHRF